MFLKNITNITDQDIAFAWREDHDDLKPEKNVYGIALHQKPYVVRFTSLKEAQQLAINAALAHIVDMNIVVCRALPYAVKEVGFSNHGGIACDGVLIMEKAPGKSFDDLSDEEKQELLEDEEFQESMLRDLVKAAVTNNHDASSTNGFFERTTRSTTWIDPECGLEGIDEKEPQEIIRLYNEENAACSYYFPQVLKNETAMKKISATAQELIGKIEASRALYVDNARMLAYHDRLQSRAQALVSKKEI